MYEACVRVFSTPDMTPSLNSTASDWLDWTTQKQLHEYTLADTIVAGVTIAVILAGMVCMVCSGAYALRACIRASKNTGSHKADRRDAVRADPSVEINSDDDIDEQVDLEIDSSAMLEATSDVTVDATLATLDLADRSN